MIVAGGIRQANRRRPTHDVRAKGQGGFIHPSQGDVTMIRKLASGQYRLYSRKIDPKTGRQRNLGTFGNRAQAEQHEREVQYFKRHG